MKNVNIGGVSIDLQSQGILAAKNIADIEALEIFSHIEPIQKRNEYEDELWSQVELSRSQS